MSQLSVTTGTEGPRHDPYHYEEITFERDGHTYVAHLGLAEWLKVDGEKRAEGEGVEALFNELTGECLSALMEAYHADKAEAWSACEKCGGEIESRSGHPGETFAVCSKCGHVNDMDFDVSAVI